MEKWYQVMPLTWVCFWLWKEQCCDSLRGSLTYLSSFWVNFEQVHMFISSYLSCILLVSFGGWRGVVYPEMVLVEKEKDCGSDVGPSFMKSMEPVFTSTALTEWRPSRLFCRIVLSKERTYCHTQTFMLLYIKCLEMVSYGDRIFVITAQIKFKCHRTMGKLKQAVRNRYS